MNTEKSYTEMLKELYETYKGKELEQVLGVTIRSVQNYLKPDNPSTPSKDVIGKIRESYAYHLKHGCLNTKNPDQSDQDLTSKYILLLETTLEEKLKKIEASLDELPKRMVDLTAKAISAQHELSLELRNGQAVIIEELEALKSTVGSFGKKLSRGQKH
jgi:predicted transcriptional regulator